MTNIAKPSRSMRMIGSAATLSALLVVGGCKSLDVENLNGVSVDGLTNNPSATAINTAAQNLLSSWRSISSGHATDLAKYGYETWQIRASEPRTLTRVVHDPKTGGYWSYGAVKNIDILLEAIEAATTLTAAQKEGLRGWLKTNLAVQYQDMVQAHNPYGIVLDLPDNPLQGDPAPIVSTADAYARIFQLLDEAYASLGNAGSSFSFRMHSGFQGFNTPANFRRVNRALYAKYKILSAATATSHTQSGNTPSGDAAWGEALTALGQTWINDGGATPGTLTFAQLNAGPFHVYPAGESNNGMAAVDRYINNRFRTQSQCKAAPCDPAVNPSDATPAVVDNRDERAWGPLAKARVVAEFSFNNVRTVLKQTDYLSPNQSTTIGNQSHLPLMRNEELILLRAEVHYNQGNYQLAIDDLNRIRVNRAGLPVIAHPYTPDAALNQPATLLEELLYEKRMSLWAENATVWLDMKHYGMVNLIPHYLPDFRIFEFFPIPDDECRIRGFSTPGCYEGGYQGIVDGPIL